MFRTLRPVDLATLVLVTMVASTGVPALLGLTDTLSLVALTMGLSCPAARRLIAWRRGAAPIRFGTDGSTALIVFAMVPWLVLPMLTQLPWTSVSTLAVTRVEMPLAIRWAGVVLAIAGVLRPMAETMRGTGRVRSSAYVETLGLFLASGNMFLGVLAASWLLLNARAVRLSPAAQPIETPSGIALA